MRRSSSIFCAVTLLAAAAAADRMPIEMHWTVPDALAIDRSVYPHLCYVLAGSRLGVVLELDESDIAAHPAARATIAFAPQLGNQIADESAMYGPLAPRREYLIAPEIPGRFSVTALVDDPEDGFTLTSHLTVVAVRSLAEVPPPPPPQAPTGFVPAVPAVRDAAGEAAPAVAPVNYARIHGPAASYLFTDQAKRFMMRGLRLELWQSGGAAAIKTVYTNDSTSEGNCGLDFEDYVDTSNIWHHSDDSGLFDFGNVFVGAGGMDLVIRVVYEYWADGTGIDTTGAYRRAAVTDADNADVQVEQWYNVGHVGSTQDWFIGVFSPELSASNGSLADEASKTVFDISRFRRYMKYCTGSLVPEDGFVGAHLQLSETRSPYTRYSDGDVVFTTWDNGYLWYLYTDSIRHEYTHAMHYGMRGNSFPPMAAGDTNHGGCANSDSADALTEGLARYFPPVIFRDGIYHWTATSTAAMSGVFDYCTAPSPDDLHEWAVGRGLYQGWTSAGSTNTYVNCTSDSIFTRDPGYVQDTFMGLVADCAYDHDLWWGFNNNGINYDSTEPTNPSGVTVTPNQRWTNDKTPTWSWTAGTDDISGVDGYGIYLSTAAGLPGATKDIEEVTSYTPAALVDGSNYYFNIRSVDHAGHWAAGYSFQGPIGIDTVPPTASLTVPARAYRCTDQGLFVVGLAWTSSDSRSGVSATRLWSRYDLGSWTSSAAVVGTSGTFFYSLASTFGRHDYYTLVSDNAGNEEYSAVGTLYYWRAGDVNGDGAPSVLDVFYLINHLYAGGPAPVGDPDPNRDGSTNVMDVFYLINYLYAAGAAPVC
ncbi:MAG TPA: dockerin type I domain-containing protein [Thermoanaerobaculaceae bacterium]|nr:dockerin type I domain-containing protein [Thermoanaerobaculaceae bacterium]HPS79113.1 dockerin type I domain-containing protein [Thermoanaerobaculaceae bacterium]